MLSKSQKRLVGAKGGVTKPATLKVDNSRSFAWSSVAQTVKLVLQGFKKNWECKCFNTFPSVSRVKSIISAFSPPAASVACESENKPFNNVESRLLQEEVCGGGGFTRGPAWIFSKSRNLVRLSLLLSLSAPLIGGAAEPWPAPLFLRLVMNPLFSLVRQHHCCFLLRVDDVQSRIVFSPHGKPGVQNNTSYRTARTKAHEYLLYIRHRTQRRLKHLYSHDRIHNLIHINVKVMVTGSIIINPSVKYKTVLCQERSWIAASLVDGGGGNIHILYLSTNTAL